MNNLQEQLTRIYELNTIINEALTDIVYHFTTGYKLLNIINTNKFLTTSTIGSDNERELSKGKAFFFSTTRSKSTGYVRGNTKLVLDGRKLTQRYKAAPINFWAMDGFSNSVDSEQEDRIMTDKPYIDNAIDYILEIHILVTESTTLSKKDINQLTELSKTKNIPIYYYQETKDWLEQNPKNRINPLDSTKLRFEDEPIYNDDEFDWEYRFFKPAALYAYNNQENYNRVLELIPREKHELFNELLRKQIRIHLKPDADYRDDTIRVYDSLLRNVKAHPNPDLRKLLELLAIDMRKLKAINIEQYLNKKYEAN